MLNNAFMVEALCLSRSNVIGDLRFEYEYVIQYEYVFLILMFVQASLYQLSHIPISSHELPSLPKTNMQSKGSGNVTDLKFKN